MNSNVFPGLVKGTCFGEIQWNHSLETKYVMLSCRLVAGEGVNAIS